MISRILTMIPGLGHSEVVIIYPDPFTSHVVFFDSLLYGFSPVSRWIQPTRTEICVWLVVKVKNK